jgi:hypothetical protein
VAAAGGTAAPGLRSLSLGGTSVTDRALSQLAGLTSLDLQGCSRLTSGGLAQALAGCQGLQRLNLAAVQVSSAPA